VGSQNLARHTAGTRTTPRDADLLDVLFPERAKTAGLHRMASCAVAAARGVRPGGYLLMLSITGHKPLSFRLFATGWVLAMDGGHLTLISTGLNPVTIITGFAGCSPPSAGPRPSSSGSPSPGTVRAP
jgi:hypothetical protein